MGQHRAGEGPDARGKWPAGEPSPLCDQHLHGQPAASLGCFHLRAREEDLRASSFPGSQRQQGGCTPDSGMSTGLGLAARR